MSADPKAKFIDVTRLLADENTRLLALLKEKDEEIEGLKTQLNDLDEILDECDAAEKRMEAIKNIEQK